MKNSKLYYEVAVVAAICLAAMMVPAYAQTSPTTRTSPASTAQSADRVVLKVGNVQVRESAMDSLIQSLSPQAKQALQRQGRKALGEQYANMLVLSQAAQNEHLNSTPEFQKQLEIDRQQLLANLEFQKLANKINVTPAEVNQYYSDHHQDFQQVQICEVAVVKKAAGSSNAGLPPAEAQAKADAIRKALTAGEGTAQVAKQFAIPNQVYVQPRTISPTDPSVPARLKTAFQLNVGAFSQTQDMPNYLEFFRVLGRPVMSLKDATPAIQEGIRRQKEAAAVANLKKQMPVWMDPSYFTPASASRSDSTHQ